MGERKLKFDKQSLTWFPKTEILDLSSYQNLENLSLSRNQLSDLDWSELAKFKNLKKLNLSYNRIQNLPSSTQFPLYPQLTVLRLVGNLIAEWPTLKANSLKNLRKLELSLNCLTSLPSQFFEELIKIEELNLSHNQLNVLPPAIGRLTQLTSLFLYENSLSSLPSSISALSSLVRLRVDSNELSSIPTGISNLQQLSLLDLSHNQLTSVPSSLAYLYSLSHLALNSNQISKIPSAIWNSLSSLQRIFLNNNFITTYHLTAICASSALSNSLEELHANNNKITSIPSNINLLSSLSILNLASNYISSLPSQLFELYNLTKLNLSGNRLKELPEAIGNLSNLTSLLVGYNQLVHLPKAISQLGQLVELFVSGNKLESLFPYEGAFLGLTSLRLVHCSNNRLKQFPNESEFSSEVLTVVDLTYNLFNPNVESSLSEWWTWFKQYKYLKISPFKTVYDEQNGNDHGQRKSAVNNPWSRNAANENDYLFGFSETQGKRQNMEDTVSYKQPLFPARKQISKAPVPPSTFSGGSFFGVFDGHGGKATAEYLRDHYHEVLSTQLQRITFPRSSNNQRSNAEEKISEAIKETFTSVNQHLLEASHSATNPYQVGASGSTAAIVVLLDNILFSANCGDCRTVVRKRTPSPSSNSHHDNNCKYAVERLSTDHKPLLLSERQRVLNNGGYVDVYGRIVEYIAVSRAFGDFSLTHLVDVLPTINHIPVTTENKNNPTTTTTKTDLVDFIILACDGVWDVITDEDAVRIVSSCYNAQEAACKLRDYAYAFGSTDNISTIVVFSPSYNPVVVQEHVVDSNPEQNEQEDLVEEDSEEVQMVEIVEDEDGEQQVLEFVQIEEEGGNEEEEITYQQIEEDAQEPEEIEMHQVEIEEEEQEEIEMHQVEIEEQEEEVIEMHQVEIEEQEEEVIEMHQVEIEEQEEEVVEMHQVEFEEQDEDEVIEMHQVEIEEQEEEQGEIQMYQIEEEEVGENDEEVETFHIIEEEIADGDEENVEIEEVQFYEIVEEEVAEEERGAEVAAPGKPDVKELVEVPKVQRKERQIIAEPLADSHHNHQKEEPLFKVTQGVAPTRTTPSSSSFSAPQVATRQTGASKPPSVSSSSSSLLQTKASTTSQSSGKVSPRSNAGHLNNPIFTERSSPFYVTAQLLNTLSESHVNQALDAFRSRAKNDRLNRDDFLELLVNDQRMAKGKSSMMLKRTGAMWFDAADKFQKRTLSFEDFLTISEKQKFFE